MLYLGKILEEDGNQVSVLDFSAELYKREKIKNALNSVDAVGITVMSEAIKKTNQIINEIKSYDPEIVTIIGGPHPTLYPKDALSETGADISIQGDGEKIICEIKKAIQGNKSLSEIPGIFYQEKSNIKHGKKYEPIADLDSLPFPSRHLVKNYIYGRAYNPKIKKGEFTSILTSRGCPYKCRFCSRGAVSLNLYRVRSTKKILEELKEIYSDGYRYLTFMDDSFLSNKKQAIEIFDNIIKEGLELKMYITAARADSADKELYLKMKKSGVLSVQFGIESGNQEILDYYNKKTTVEKIRNAVNLSHESGFFTSGTVILGAPYETKKHFQNTLKFIKSLPIDTVSFLPLRYMAGSELWKEAVKTGKISEKEYLVHASSDKDLGFYSENELLKYCKNLQRSFYQRPKYLINLLKKSIENNDYSLLNMFLSIYLSSIKKNLNPIKGHT